MSFATAKEGKVISEMSAFGIGSPVVYVDSLGRERPALVTNCFGPLESNPSINVVVVNDDENQTDTYGRKIERFTSVVHQSSQYAHGNYWKPISE
jgi:ureidoglycolate hydrolase